MNSDVLTRFAAAGAATVYEAYGRKGDMNPAIRRISSSRQIAGPAFCVQCAVGDNLALHRAVAEANAGDILVVSGGGGEYGYLGDILAEAAMARGVAGIVMDGSVRDAAELARMDFPVWARGLAIRGATKNQPGRLAQPIDCGGIRVTNGDLVVADDDGVAIVAQKAVSEVMSNMNARLEQESAIRQALRQGDLTLDLLNLRRYISPPG